MYRDALQGTRILDFTWLLAGPYATRLLADFGAEVIKIQSRKTAKGAESNDTGYFNMWNRNKLGITLDMSYPEAREIVRQLVNISDVVVENFTPRVMSNWGLSYETLKEVKPDLILGLPDDPVAYHSDPNQCGHSPTGDDYDEEIPQQPCSQ